MMTFACHLNCSVPIMHISQATNKICTLNLLYFRSLHSVEGSLEMNHCHIVIVFVYARLVFFSFGTQI